MLLRCFPDVFAALPPFPVRTTLCTMLINIGGGVAAGIIVTPSEKQSFSANRAAKAANSLSASEMVFYDSVRRVSLTRCGKYRNANDAVAAETAGDAAP